MTVLTHELDILHIPLIKEQLKIFTQTIGYTEDSGERQSRKSVLFSNQDSLKRSRSFESKPPSGLFLPGIAVHYRQSRSELLRVIVQFRHNCSSVPSINWNTSVLIVFHSPYSGFKTFYSK